MVKKMKKGNQIKNEFTEIHPGIFIQKSQSSVSVERDSKGATKFEVKVYADDADEAMDKATEIYDKLSKKYRNE